MVLKNDGLVLSLAVVVFLTSSISFLANLIRAVKVVKRISHDFTVGAEFCVITQEIAFLLAHFTAKITRLRAHSGSDMP